MSKKLGKAVLQHETRRERASRTSTKAKLALISLAIILLGALTGVVAALIVRKNTEEIEHASIATRNCNLPTPEVTGGARGELGIDKNVNEKTLDDYLGCDDVIYRDMRMLEDPGNYEAIGGDRYLSGYVEGFQVVPLPYLMPVTGLPEEVGKTYDGTALFSQDAEGNYVANYEESLELMEQIFPKDKKILLMCGGGGYAGMTKRLLVALGWDESKIWNVGGYWYYDGAHKVEVKKVDENGKSYYDFDEVDYIEIKFDELTSTKSSSLTTTTGRDRTTSEIKKPIRLTEKYYNYASIEHYDNIRMAKTDDEVEDGTGLSLEKYNEARATEKAKIINEAIAKKESFIVAAHSYDGACGGADSAEFTLESHIGHTYFSNYNVDSDSYTGGVFAYEANLPTFKKTKLYETVKYAPTLIVVKDGEVYAFIDNNKDNIRSDEELNAWIKTYVEV
ncbi:hypothetical protein IKF15_01905 [Candidatus Saccharibacteria bacterium]|nr:hypothetical protein [Candidatus Saccharibacteria bacterium]